jgi:hypothetical protein
MNVIDPRLNDLGESVGTKNKQLFQIDLLVEKG